MSCSQNQLKVNEDVLINAIHDEGMVTV